MKKFVSAVAVSTMALTLGLSQNAAAQQQGIDLNWGVYAGLVQPLDDLADKTDLGFDLGVRAITPTPNILPRLSLGGSVDFAYLTGDDNFLDYDVYLVTVKALGHYQIPNLPLYAQLGVGTQFWKEEWDGTVTIGIPGFPSTTIRDSGDDDGTEVGISVGIALQATPNLEFLLTHESFSYADDLRLNVVYNF
ncbi:MAG: outer membrane beta-barrel protein [Thermodesulfobacteriota bacterium]